MLTLRSSPTTPFGRKIQMAIITLGLSERISVEKTDTLDPNDSIRTQNPLGKIPTLVLEDGTTLYDSRVIAEYLDYLSGGNKLIPAEPKARFATLKLQALADGIMDAGILRVYEARFRTPEYHSEQWLAHQAEKMNRGLTILEGMNLPAPNATPDIGAITLAALLGWLDLRFSSWRADHLHLSLWLDNFAATVPAFIETTPVTS